MKYIAKKTILSLVIFVSVLHIISIVSFSYPWPFSSSDEQHPIVGTLAEYRPGHFHAGVDIAEPVGTNVYPAVSGTITQMSNSSIEDGHVYIDGSDDSWIKEK